jgi:hypothetical protein
MLESERVMTLGLWTDVFLDLQRQPFLAQIRSIKDADTTVWQAAQKAWTPRRTVLSQIDRYYRESIAESKKSIPLRATVATPADPWSSSAVEALSMLASSGWTREALLKTQLMLLEVALAVRQHYLQHGAYPRRLEEIDRKWLPAIPTDCWDQPVAYRLKNGQPVIYSLGPDGKDDGGQATDPLDLRPQTRGDLVFGQLSYRLQRSLTSR